MRPAPERWSSSDLSRSCASWVSQVTVSSRVSVTGTPRMRCGRDVRRALAGPLGVILRAYTHRQVAGPGDNDLGEPVLRPFITVQQLCRTDTGPVRERKGRFTALYRTRRIRHASWPTPRLPSAGTMCFPRARRTVLGAGGVPRGVGRGHRQLPAAGGRAGCRAELGAQASRAITLIPAQPAFPGPAGPGMRARGRLVVLHND